VKGNARGYGFNAGIYYKPTSVLSLGLTYHSAVTMDVKKGEANFTVPASLTASFPSGDFSTSLSLPKIITFRKFLKKIVGGLYLNFTHLNR
jgi:long-chain fatty acid transport protein